MSGRAWRLSERILLLAVVFFAALAAFRMATREPTPPQRQDAGHPPAEAGASHPGSVTGPPPSPACTELLARIRSYPEKNLEGVIDKMSAMEAMSLFQQLTPSDRRTVFAAVPAPILARKANALLGVPETCFRNTRQPGLLAASLVDAALGAPGGAADLRKAMCFATAIDAWNVPQSPRSAFRPDERKIYACLDAGSASKWDAGVLVRWSEEASGALVYLHYLPLAVNRRWNFVFFEVADNWTPGTYRVRFYRVGESAGLLAEGTYLIRSDN